MPSHYARLLGFTLRDGMRKKIITGNGMALAYTHMANVAVGECRVKNVPIDFVPHLNVVLLGTNGFLSRFVLTVDYPRRKFSLKLSK
jgi:predicted aspartyl protease